MQNKRPRQSDQSDNAFSPLQARLQIQALKREITNLKAASQTTIINLEKANQALTIQSKDDAKTILKLEEDRKFLFEQKQPHIKDQEEVIESNQKATSIPLKEFNSMKDPLKDQIKELTNRNKEIVRNHEYTVEKLDDKINSMNVLIKQYQKEMQEYIKTNHALNSKISQLQSQLPTTASPIQQHQENHQGFTVLTKNLVEMTARVKKGDCRIQTLEKEIVYLKSIQGNTEKLLEEKNSLEAKLKYIQDKTKPLLSTLQHENSVLKSEKQKWISLISDDSLSTENLNSIDAPYKISRELALQRIENSVLRDRLGQGSAKEIELKNRVKSMQLEIKDLSEKIGKLESENDRDKLTIKRLEKSKGLSAKEVEFLRGQLNTYDMEESMTTGVSSINTVRINELNQLIDEYKLQINALEQELKNTQNEASTPTRQPTLYISQDYCGDEEKDVKGENDLRIKCEMYQKEIGLLEKQVSALKESSERDYRIVQLSLNPEQQEQAIRTQQLDLLTKENQSLRRTIAHTNEQTKHYPIESFTTLHSQLQAKTEEVQQVGIRLTRLKSVFQAKVLEYREVVLKILGWKFEVHDNGLVKFTGSGGLGVTIIQEEGRAIVKCDGGDQYNEKIEYFVREAGNVPGFMAWAVLQQ